MIINHLCFNNLLRLLNMYAFAYLSRNTKLFTHDLSKPQFHKKTEFIITYV